MTSTDVVPAGLKEFPVEDVVSVHSGCLISLENGMGAVYSVINHVLDTSISTIGILVVSDQVNRELERQFPWLAEVKATMPKFSEGIREEVLDDHERQTIIEGRIREYNGKLAHERGATLMVARKAGPAYETNPFKDIADYDAKNGTNVMGKTVALTVDPETGQGAVAGSAENADAVEMIAGALNRTHIDNAVDNDVCVEPALGGCGQPVADEERPAKVWHRYHRTGLCPNCQARVDQAADDAANGIVDAEIVEDEGGRG